MYGRVRMFGSLGFWTGGIIASYIADVFPASPTSSLIVATVGWLIAFIRACTFRPPYLSRSTTPLMQGRRKDGFSGVISALGKVFSQPGMILFLLALPLHAIGWNSYDAWFANHVSSLGLPSRWVGMALTFAVGGEIVVLYSSERILKSGYPLLALLTFAFLVGVVRFLITALITDPIILATTQVLHGITFALFWMLAMELVRKASIPEVRSSAQAVISFACSGIGPIIVSSLATYFPGRHLWKLFMVSSVADLGAAGLALMCYLRSPSR